MLNCLSMFTKVNLVLAIMALATAAYADCTTPAGVEGQIIYNSTAKMLQFCNGTNWIDMAYFEMSSVWRHMVENLA